MTNASWTAAPLVWGRGPRLFELFIEPTCPYSVKAWGKIPELMDRLGPDRLTVRIWLNSQPWHLVSGIVIRCILAASTLPDGRDAARTVMEAAMAHREEFEFEKHWGGPNLDRTPRQLIAQLEAYSGLKLFDAYSMPDLDREMKRHAKFCRQNGAHVTPTFMIDGIIDPAISSGDAVDQWAAKLA